MTQVCIHIATMIGLQTKPQLCEYCSALWETDFLSLTSQREKAKEQKWHIFHVF